MCFTAGWYGLGEKDALLHVPPRQLEARGRSGAVNTLTSVVTLPNEADSTGEATAMTRSIAPASAQASTSSREGERCPCKGSWQSGQRAYSPT